MTLTEYVAEQVRGDLAEYGRAPDAVATRVNRALHAPTRGEGTHEAASRLVGLVHR